MYSSDAKEIVIATQYVHDYYEKIAKIEKEVQKRREYRKYLKENDKIDIQNGLKKLLYKKLETLTSFEKLEIMASDTKHSPQFYPSNMVYQVSEEDIQKLDEEKKQNLKKILSIKIKGFSPWAKFKKRYTEIVRN